MVDFTEFKQFIKDFKIAQKEWEKIPRDFLVEMAYRVIERAVYRTPVDTGALRAAWQIGDIKVVDDSGNVIYIDVSSQISGRGTNLQIEILNGMEYASYVEFGHATVGRTSWVNGRYMLTISINEIENILDQAFQIRFKEWAKQMGFE